MSPVVPYIPTHLKLFTELPRSPKDVAGHVRRYRALSEELEGRLVAERQSPNLVANTEGIACLP
jgi:hypothetical protein